MEKTSVRILYVGNSGGMENIDRFYLFPPRIINGLIRNNHQVQVFNDKDVARLCNVFRSSRLGIKKTNQFLVKNCSAFKPDLIILAHCQFIYNETIEEIRQLLPNTRIVHLNVDPLSGDGNRKRILDRVGYVDGIFITTAGPALKTISSPKTFSCFIPNPVDLSIDTGRAFENRSYNSDLFFAANKIKGDEDHRELLVNQIQQNLSHLKLDILGYGANRSSFGMDYIERLTSAKMGLIINKTEDFYLYASDRMSQYMANGLMTFAHENPHYNDIFQNDEIVTYASPDELIEKINYYHAHDSERIQIAEKGYTKIHHIFNNTLVTQYMVEMAMGDIKNSYPWPTEKYFGDK